MNLGEKIKLLRNEHEMTQPELSEKAGIEQSYLSKLENGKGSPSFDIINRIAIALGTTGMDLINSLSWSYIETHLSHIPEVAAEYESIKLRREISMKKRFIIASVLIIGGVGIYLAGYLNAFFPEQAAFEYYSEGIILDGEPDYLFDTPSSKGREEMSQVLQIVETGDEMESRLRLIRNRLDEDTFVSYEYLGNSLIQNVDGGRRKFFLRNALQGSGRINRRQNDVIASLGIMLVVAGLLGIVYSLKFKPA